MKSSNSPHGPKGNSPDSDETARSAHPDAADEAIESASTDIQGLQTSNKSGKHSSVEKLAASRPEFGSGRGAQPVPGAFGDDESHPVTGRNALPDTNKFRCNACGRYFNAPEELSAHEVDCRLAKSATTSGRDSLRQQDSTPHDRNDADSKATPFDTGRTSANKSW